MGRDVVGRSPDAARNERVPAVGADHDLRLLAYERAAWRATADAHDPSALGQELLNRESLTHLRASCGGRLDQDLVEDGAADRIAHLDVTGGRRGARERKGPDVEREGADRRGTRALDLGQQPPALEAGNPRLVNVMGRERVAREACPVQEQDAVAPARKQHRRW